MMRLDPPRKFTFRPEEWPEWSTEFKRFQTAGKLHLEDGEIQRDTFIHCMGHEKHEEVQIGAVLNRAGDVLNGDGNAAKSSLFSEQVDAVMKADVVLGNSAEAGLLENEMVTVDG
ncbi:tyrosine recombinase xerc [Plakobranchus ocellatus]|uniref:Tyrosine recombinase xerc n=1 Tax=Plakobranchus ocellatus TaxID=259542 RepID=A0AAV3YRD0_9GAST|nr:tyrosine recombinase xerc [Plakobranchus ocellatus]